MLVHRRVTPSIKRLPQETTQCVRPGLEHRPHDPESSALTVRLPASEVYRLLPDLDPVKNRIQYNVN